MLAMIHEYKGYEYRHDDSVPELPYVLLFERKPLIEFESYESLTNFVDHAIDLLEQTPQFKDYKLHLTGCARCRKTANGGEVNPCETGREKFIHGKNAAVIVSNHLVEAITSLRKGEDTPSGE